MSEDIRFKISADESGAVNAFKKVRSEVLNNEHGLKALNKEGKTTGKSLKDMASVLGPEFGILGDRIDHMAGALNDVNGAGLAAKAGLVGLVSVGAWQVGSMLGDFIFETEKWAKTHEEAVKKITDGNTFIARQTEDRFQKQIALSNLAASQETQNAELSTLRDRTAIELGEAKVQLFNRENELKIALGNDFFFMGTQDNAISEERVRLAKEHVEMLEKQFNQVDRLASARQSDLDMQISQRKAAAEAEQERQKNIAKEEADAEKLKSAQTTYLDSLDLELVRLKEGEEAYTRLSLAKQGFTQDTVDAAVAMKAEIEAIKQAEAETRKVSPTDKDVVAKRQDQPGNLQATQQRFITRGSGPNLEKMVADNTKQSAATLAELRKLQQDMAARSRRHFEFLERQLEGTV
jgi:hypothetical protein